MYVITSYYPVVYSVDTATSYFAQYSIFRYFVPLTMLKKQSELHRHRPQIERMSDSKELRFPDLETVPNLGTKGYHCKELPVPRG